MAPVHLASVPEIQHKIQSQLTLARQHLVEDTVPQRLRIMSYLRICYAAAQVYRVAHQKPIPGLPERKPYLQLLNDLGQCHPKWWEHCVISPRGYLRSQLLPLDLLLTPIREFVLTQSTELVA